MSSTTNDRLYSHCVWYAFGQQDAGIGKGRGVEVAEFAQSYVDHAMSGSSFIPSIQDAWKAYIARVAMDNAEQTLAIAGISDEVRDFLAKAIDNLDDSNMADLDAIDDDGPLSFVRGMSNLDDSVEDLIAHNPEDYES